ncbi:MAG: ferric reductase-like transmembrane domain-containing protein [Pseudomonadota bacterium]
MLSIAAAFYVAATSPLLQWRDPIYVTGGFAGVLALALLLIQPLLAGGRLAGISAVRSRYLHRWVGGGLVVAVLAHVGALWITSPPDVIDALLFVSPTPFAVWGVLAMWAIFAAAALAAFRKRLPFHIWRGAHMALAVITVSGSVLHAVLIEGTMGVMSKAVLCGCVLFATALVIAERHGWLRH